MFGPSTYELKKKIQIRDELLKANESLIHTQNSALEKMHKQSEEKNVLLGLATETLKEANATLTEVVKEVRGIKTALTVEMARNKVLEDTIDKLHAALKDKK